MSERANYRVGLKDAVSLLGDETIALTARALGYNVGRARAAITAAIEGRRVAFLGDESRGICDPGGIGKAVAIWTWDAAPPELRSLSTRGGDEDFVALIPNGVDGSFVRDRIFQYAPDVEEIAYDDGTLLIVAH